MGRGQPGLEGLSDAGDHLQAGDGIGCGPGSIVLFHNAALHTPEALPSVLEYMIQEGYTVVPIGQLIYWENYTIDHTGRQFPAEAAQ